MDTRNTHGHDTPAIAFQGEPGAFSELACTVFAPEATPLACPTFEKTVQAVRSGQAERAMLPVENSLAGRVSDIHRLLPVTGLHIVAEHFLPVEHHLMAVRGTAVADLRTVRSHSMALDQCREVIGKLGLIPEVSGDTAGAAKRLAESGRKDQAVIGSARAAEIYGLEILIENIEDADHNTTRFLEMAGEPPDVQPGDGRFVTSFVFQVRNIPAALYKALGGFATNGINLTKIESYQPDGTFSASMFYTDAEGHPQDPAMQLALEELGFFSSSFTLLGVYRSARDRG